jgi:hypothetical protein
MISRENAIFQEDSLVSRQNKVFSILDANTPLMFGTPSHGSFKVGVDVPNPITWVF